MAEAFQADRDRDVIVQHVRETGNDATSLDRWVIYLGTTKRGESGDQSGALVFARLLADIVKRPIWVCTAPETSGVPTLDRYAAAPAADGTILQLPSATKTRSKILQFCVFVTSWLPLNTPHIRMTNPGQNTSGPARQNRFAIEREDAHDDQ